ERHYRRLLGLVDDAQSKGARVVSLSVGSEMLSDRMRKIAPTLLVGVSNDMAVMREEIFGPILPIETYATVDDAIARINARPRPRLAGSHLATNRSRWRDHRRYPMAFLQ